jgi:hypothetical protein
MITPGRDLLNNLLWTGREYYSLENCLVTTTKQGFHVRSVIVGQYEGVIYKVDYDIQTNADWETLAVSIRSQQNNQQAHYQFESDGKGNWKNNEHPEIDFKGCIDVDIPLTPFTNTLPINRLKLKEKEEQIIRVIYFDLLQQKIIPVQQKYIRLSGNVYKYENIPNDFEAKITVDEDGFVVDYPSLFVRTNRLVFEI